ncbi:MAG: ABC transporter ATP-binding protein [Longimicrobiales bacterium]
MIEVEGLTRYYGDFAAVTDLSFRVAPGEVVGMLGPNGAGKTTTLRSLVGIIRPTRGKIRICSHDLATDAIAAKQQLAFIPDEPQLFDHLTVREHLQFIARIYNVEGSDSRIDELLGELDLRDKVDTLPDALSRGMKQKLAIACGLLHDPRALLLDEPLTGLDPGAIRRTKQTILNQAKRGAAVILSSHLLTLVEELCTRLIVIDHGKLVAMGTIDEIAASKPELAGRGLEDLFLALTGSS